LHFLRKINPFSNLAYSLESNQYLIITILKTKITLKEVWKTIHADLIGKDSNRGITLTYGWMANQTGHFALGFIPTLVVFHFLNDALLSLIYVASFWTAFEIYNASSPLFMKAYKGNGAFKLHWSNLLYDTFTDLNFFWLGGATCFIIIDFHRYFMFGLLIGLFAILFSVRFWFLTKLYQQNAFFPYQFRLSQWRADINELHSKVVNQFVKELPSNKHFLVFGHKGSGKTKLMVGMANEASIRKRKSTYTTFSKWVTLLQEDNNTLKETGNSLWLWTESDILVIDDINPGLPKEADKYLANDALSYIKLQHEARNAKALVETNVIWIVGSCAKEETTDNWIEMLQKLKVDPDNIIVIDLDKI